jgi:multidrug efflux pump subunit AcrA (membrane-fusion protein)
MKIFVFPWRHGRRICGCLTLVALLGWPAWSLTTVSPPSASKAAAQEPVTPRTLAIEVMGRTQCILTRKCSIAPVPLHPVTEVLAQPGSRVKKGQPLVKLDDDEPRADVRAKEAALESAQIALGPGHK